MAHSEPIITIEDVGLAFGQEQIYDRLSFDVRAGEFICILGPSGCGKSTLLRVIGGLLDPNIGRVTVDGRPPRDAWAEIAFVFQSPRLVPWRTALDPNMRSRMRVEMERIWLKTGKTVVFVTHDIDEALQLADRTVVLSNKPTRVLEIIELQKGRPRALADRDLDTRREKLVNLFRSLEQPALHKETVA